MKDFASSCLEELKELPFFTPLGWLVMFSLMFWVTFIVTFIYCI